MDKDIPKLDIEKEKNEIKYYQWVNFLLLIQAFLYYTPRIFWNTFSIKAGLYLGDLVNVYTQCRVFNPFYSPIIIDN